MTNLTEQWKKGELPYGRYYVELAYNGNNIIMAEYWWDKALTLDDHEYSREEVKRILAPVPSFEQWQQLKELLKECRSPINYALCLNLSEEEKKEFKNLLAKINQVLGEE